MMWQNNTYAIPVLLFAIPLTSFAIVAWRRRPAHAAMLFLLLAIGGAWSMVSYALELLSTDLNTIRFWVIMQYAANLTIPAVWVLFVQVYTGQEQVLRRRRAAWLFVIPAIHFALALTNDYHHLNWQYIGTRTVDGLVFFDRTYGVIFWVGVLYQQLLLVFSSAVILRATRRASALFRGQVTPLVVAVSFPWIANFLTIFNLNPIPHIDLLPFSLALMCIPLGWSLFRYRLFDLIPAARSKVVESMGDAVFVLDSQDRFIDLNPAAERLMRRRLSDIIGYSVEHLLPGAREMVEQFRGVHEAHLEYTIGPEDRKAYYDLGLSPLYNHQGELTGRVVVMRDITSLKKADQAIRQYATELEARNRELDAFSHTVAHDLKAPLLIILGYTGLLLEDEQDRLSPSAGEFLKNIQASASRMSEMINNLLVLANLRKVDGTFAEVRIGPIVQAAVERFKLDIDKRGVSIQVMPDLPAVVAQPTLVEEVFANLINNAIKYIGKDNPAPTVHVRGSRNGDKVRFEVQDNGLGIAPQDQSKLFDMFSRFHPEEASGMGLGLSIVQRIITRLNGEIGVESAPGQGSTFWFTLPAASGTSEAVAMQRETLMTSQETRYDVIVLGLGVMGSAASYHLARAGKRVLALEQFELDHRMGSSYGESRIIRYAYAHPTYIEMAKAAFPMWRELEADSGRRLMFQTGGLDFGPAGAATLNAARDNLRGAGIACEWLSPGEVMARFPQFRPGPDMMGLYQPDAAYLAASQCVIAQAEMAQKYGATLRTKTPVLSIEPLPGAVRVHTAGAVYEAGALVIAAGPWAPKMLGALGLSLPLQPTREQIVFFNPTERALFEPPHMPTFIFHQQPWYYGLPNVDGTGFKAAIHCNGEPTDPDTCKRTADSDYIEQIREFVEQYLPRGVGPITDSRVCLYTMTPDEHFIIDRHPAHPNIVFGAGFSGHGFKFGILIGRILADLATGGATPFDLSLFRADRFKSE